MKRATFVIDTDRTVRKVIASELNMDVHADEALAALRPLVSAAADRPAPVTAQVS